MSVAGEWVTLPTGQGPARVQVHPAAGSARGTLVLAHGAGGGTDAKDLQSLLAATAHGWHVGLVEHPWKVAGRKIATRPPTLDAAWRDILPALLADDGPLPGAAGLQLVVGGRSAGARVACRTSGGDPEAGLARADGVLCLAFPLHPPGKPDTSRAPELALPLGARIPTLVVQGSADPFGSPAEVMEAVASEPGAATHLQVVEVPGNHSPSREQSLVSSSALVWLDRLG